MNGDLEPPLIDLDRLRLDRMSRLRATMLDHGLELLVLTNPVSIRYATDYRGYATFQSRIPSQYLLVPVDGPVLLRGAYTNDLSTIDDCAVAHSITTFDAGLDLTVAAARFASDIGAHLRTCGLDAGATIGIERTTPSGHVALREHGLRVVDAEPTVELARSRKSELELRAMRHTIAVAELAIARMHERLQPGLSENQLFSVLHQTNVAHDGDWIDGRMLSSGPRTNPWYQEAGARRIESGELVAFDTDMVGPFGYCADISRTWVCDAAPSPAQRDLYARAREEIDHNMSLLRPGASFRELSTSVFRHPDRFIANRYACAFHGVGMTDEYPKIPYPQDWEWTGYDGELEAGTVLAVESYVGADGGVEGVKLEQMVQVTDDAVVPLSTYPLWD